jgi:plasmid stabilization system protein ParE
VASSAVRFLEAAQAEAWAIEAWYRERSPAAADRFIVALRQAVVGIAEQPRRWPPGRRGTRHCLLWRFPFRVAYRIDDLGVCVVAIAHAKRRPGYWSNR